MCPEKQFLFCCARTHIDKKTANRIRILLGKSLDWDYILDRGAVYGISSLLFQSLKESDVGNDVPQSVMDRLKRFHHSTGLRNMRIFAELGKVLDTLCNKGIPAILLKGAALVNTVYQDAALRPMSDVDFLVRKSDLNNVLSILSDMGYIPLPGDSVDQYRKHHHSIPYIKHDKSIMIEVHHNIASKPFMSMIDTDCLWRDTQSISISGTEAHTLSPENLIIHLCLHISDDLFVERMKVLVDISETIRYYGRHLDWEAMVRRSNEWGAGSFVYYSLYLAEQMMDAVVPSYVLSSLKPVPELRSFEAGLLKLILRRNIIRRPKAFIPSWLITSLCQEFFFTLKTLARVKNILRLITTVSLGRNQMSNYSNYP